MYMELGKITKSNVKLLLNKIIRLDGHVKPLTEKVNVNEWCSLLIDDYFKIYPRRDEDNSDDTINANNNGIIYIKAFVPDAEFNDLCLERHIHTETRPCTIEGMRAHATAKQIAEPKAPMQRNRDIVADADVMIACPPNYVEIKRGSGTWATIKFTRRAKKPLYIVFPNGKIQKERVEK